MPQSQYTQITQYQRDIVILQQQQQQQQQQRRSPKMLGLAMDLQQI